MKNTILYKFVLKNPHWMLIVALGTVAAGWTRAVGASYVGRIIDQLVYGPNVLMPIVIVGFVFMFFAYFLRWLTAVVCLYLTEKLSLEVRIKIITHLAKIPFISYEEYSSGNLQSIIRNDVDVASELLYNLFSRILNNVFLFLFSIYYMFLVDAATAAVVIAFIIGMGLINQYILSKLKKPQQEVRQSIGRLTDITENTFLGMDTVKTYSAKDYILSFFRQEKAVYNTNELKSAKIDAGRLTLYNLVNTLSIFLSLFYLGYMAIIGVISIGEVFMFIYLLKQIFVPVEVIFRWMSRIVTSNAAWTRIYTLLEESASETSQQHIDSALNNLSYTLNKGQLNRLEGESGSGKTTLLKILLGLYPRDISLSGGVSFAPSDSQLFNISIYENIAIANDKITKELCISMAQKLGIADWINSLPEGLDTIINESNLSGGQRQMINNMRALLTEQPVIIMDEPFSALDKDREKSLLTVINELCKDKIILITSHSNR